MHSLGLMTPQNKMDKTVLRKFRKQSFKDSKDSSSQENDKDLLDIVQVKKMDGWESHSGMFQVKVKKRSDASRSGGTNQDSLYQTFDMMYLSDKKHRARRGSRRSSQRNQRRKSNSQGLKKR